MSVVRNLAEVSKQKQKEYFESFDTVLLDMDGVIWEQYKAIKGAPDCIRNLKKLGKAVRYVTNNTIKTLENFVEYMRANGIETKEDDIVNPIQTIIACLKKSDIRGDVYVIGSKPIKDEIRKRGFNLVPESPPCENLYDILDQYDGDRKVDAVILDQDFQFTHTKMQKAFWYLRNNPDCKFFLTMLDKYGPFGSKGPIFGMYYFAQAIQDLSCKEYIVIGKPSEAVAMHIKEKFELTEPERVLFIGDSIQTDMNTAAIGGFQKLLVLSGTDKIQNVENWEYPEEYKPEYYVGDLAIMNDLIKSVYQF